jgi:hypothetical protein
MDGDFRTQSKVTKIKKSFNPRNGAPNIQQYIKQKEFNLASTKNLPRHVEIRRRI